MVSGRAMSSVIARSDGAKAPERRSNLLFHLLVLTIIGCTPASATASADPLEPTNPGASATISPVPPTALPPITGLSAQQIRNADYQLGFTDVPRTVQLTSGFFQQGASGAVDYMEIRVTDFIALGDLNGDGVNEAAAVISENYGGTGVFVFLTLYVEQSDQPVFLTSAFIDDRPAVNGIEFVDDAILLQVTTHGTEDPFCCPTLRNERQYRLINNQLVMTDYVTFTPDGRPRTITIESPAYGSEVFNSVQMSGSVAIAPFENNLTYRIYDLGGVELSAGAINVIAADHGAPGMFDQMIPLGDILSGAVIRIEIQDISAADGSLFAMDSVELVVK